jgi:hypothetical protein
MAHRVSSIWLAESPPYPAEDHSVLFTVQRTAGCIRSAKQRSLRERITSTLWCQH